jgi:hypothetical protein
MQRMRKGDGVMDNIVLITEFFHHCRSRLGFVQEEQIVLEEVNQKEEEAWEKMFFFCTIENSILDCFHEF